MNFFKLIKKDAETDARRGVITTPHGVVEVAIFYAGGNNCDRQNHVRC